MSETLAWRVFVTSLVFLILATTFAYGLAVERFQLWPYATIHAVWRAASSIAEFGQIIPEGRRVPAPAGASRQTVTIHDPARMNDGYYVFVGWSSTDELYEAWLYDSVGNLEHVWRIDYSAFDPDGPSNGADNPHAFELFNDGSIVVGFDKGDVMARLDACGEPMWLKEGIYHHSLSRAEDGSLWVWRGDGTAYGHFNYIENFDAESGRKIRELGLIEDIIMHQPAVSVVFGVRQDYPFQRFSRDPEDQDATDLFHPNDVESLPSNIARMFPLFEAGDLLISLRTLNLVAVIDPRDGRLKWYSHGPWIGQHDPDFTADGKISVYDNNTGRGRSEIVKIDPLTREISNDLSGGEVEFSSEFMGKHQYLPNGNVLIVVPGEGRILEVTADGELVMEFNNLSVSSTNYNEHVENGSWVPRDYFQTFPTCAK